MDQRLGIGRRDLIDFRLKLQDKVLEYLYETRQEGVYMIVMIVTSDHSRTHPDRPACLTDLLSTSLTAL